MEIKSNKIELIDIGSIVPNPKNANTHPPEQIKRLEKLIQFQGFRNPLIVSNRTGFLVVGHGRLEAAINLKMDKLPVIRQDFESEAQEYAYLVSDNEIARWADLDNDKMIEDLKAFDDLDIEMLGIEDFEIPEIEMIPESDEDDIPDVVDPITKRGDIWLLGKHRLMCGDSTMIDDVEKLMNGEKADMVFTDPPYNQETEGGCKGNIGKSLRKQSSEIESMCDFNPEQLLQIVPSVFEKNKMNSLIFCNKDLVVDYLRWGRDSGYAYNILFWKKPSAIPLGGSYRPDVEYLLVFRRSGIFNGGISECNYSKCMEHDREKGKVHPTMKPVEMIENQIKICSNKHSRVLDFFGGSGSTLIACEKTSRNNFSMELDEKYCDVIINRWQNYTGKNATLESNNKTYNELSNE